MTNSQGSGVNRNLLERQVAEKMLFLSSASHSPTYRGGYYDHRSGGAKWPGGLSGDGLGFSVDHRRSRQNGRNAFHDSSVARATVERYRETVAGVGLRFKSAINYQVLGISRDRAERIGEDINDRFHLWAKSQGSSRSWTMNLYQAQGLYAIEQQRDNDQFVRLYYSDEPDLLNPLQFEFIDPEQIAGDAFTSTRGYPYRSGIQEGSRTEDDIIRNDAGREIGYKVRVKKDGVYETVVVPAFEPRSRRRMMLHGFYSEYAGQKRGYSRLHSIVQDCQAFEDFNLSHIQKAIQQAQFWMFIQPSDDSDAVNPLADLAEVPAGLPSRQYGSHPQPAPDAENVTDESLMPVEHHHLPIATFHTPGSNVIANAKRGQKVVPFESTAPADQYDRFANSFVTFLSAVRGVPREVALLDFNKNFSAHRAALILFWRIAMIWQMEMDADFLSPLKETWMSEEIAMGRFSLPGWSDPVLRAAWMAGTWRGFPLPNIDPLRNSKANRMDAEMGAKDLDMIAWETSQSEGKNVRINLERQWDELPLSKSEQIRLNQTKDD
jgi:capsid protein